MKYTEDAPKSDEVVTFEDLLEEVGSSGWRNYFILIFASLSTMITPLPLFSYQFLGATPEHWCYVDQLVKSNWTEEQIKDVAIPHIHSNGVHAFSECQMYNLNYSLLSEYGYDVVKWMIEAGEVRRNATLRCPTRYFVKHVETIVNEWDLVCDRRPLYSTTQAAVQAGNLIGSIFIGYFNDKYGRIFMYRICVILYIILGFVTSISPNISVYIILRFFSTVNAMGFYIASFVLCMELSSMKQRSCVGSFFPLPWALGIMLTAGLAYLFPQWNALQVALTFPGLILIIGCWILPESPRWLILNGKHRQASEILKTIAKSNARPIPSDMQLLEKMKIIEFEHSSKDIIFEEKSIVKKCLGILEDTAQMLINPSLRRQTLAVFFCWFSASLVYYGVSLGSTSLSTDDYLYIFLSGVIEIPSYLFLFPLVEYFGRRKVLILCYLMSGVSILAVMGLVMSNEHGENSVLRLLIFLMGKFTITAAFQLIWIYTAELYPTNFRSLIVGEASAAARVGSICSPYVNDILVKVASWSPPAVFGVFAVIAGLVSFTFTETSGKNLPESIRDTTRREADRDR